MLDVKTYPISQRKNKVSIEDFATIGTEFQADFFKIPNILAGKDFRELVDCIVSARYCSKPVIMMIGAHVIKCGLNLPIIALMERGVVTAIAMNGGASIHDFEIALIGETSEDVDAGIKDGTFGMAEETGRYMNEAIQGAAEKNIGMGKALGEKLTELNSPHLEYSILAAGVRIRVPVTVHVAIGTDIIHQHPSADGGSIGQTSYADFHTFVSVVSTLNGGVLLNIGSAVILPEVFLKALAITRNLGHNVSNFTTANFDMIQHYRQQKNVVQRPVNAGGQGYSFIGRHEFMIPLLVNSVIWGINHEVRTEGII